MTLTRTRGEGAGTVPRPPAPHHNRARFRPTTSASDADPLPLPEARLRMPVELSRVLPILCPESLVPGVLLIPLRPRGPQGLSTLSVSLLLLCLRPPARRLAG